MYQTRFHARQAAAALLKMAKTTSDPRVAAGLIEAAAYLKDQAGELPPPLTTKPLEVGPGGASATVGESHACRDRDRDRTTVAKEREPADRKTVIKKEDESGNREKTVIHHDKD